MSADQAFDYLGRTSSHANRKVATVAAEIAETRRDPRRWVSRAKARFLSASGLSHRASVA
jgi:hypothetical protein